MVRRFTHRRNDPRTLGWPSTKGCRMNEWVIVGIVALIVLLFGAKKLPELARSVGKSTSEFKKGMAEGSSEDETKPAESSDKPPTE